MIKIVTVYNSLNPGSFLQATSLYTVIEDKYRNAYFLHTNARNTFVSGIKVFLKLCKSLYLKDAISEIIMPLKYWLALKKFNISQSASGDKDVFIVGSDEIWNESRNDVSKYKVFWGYGLHAQRCIAYAPSVNNAKYEDYIGKKYINKALDEFYSLSVRDAHSLEVLSKLTKREIQLVCDPVMLLPLEYYRTLYKSKNREYKYIFVYGPERHFTKENANAIKLYAKENNLKLISYYFSHKWVDEVLFGDPYEFLELIDDSEYVITSTFHGTMFSIMYNKRFAVFGENQKVNEALDQFSLVDRLCNDGKISDILSSDINYTNINSLVSEIAANSRRYLYNSVDAVMDIECLG